MGLKQHNPGCNCCDGTNNCPDDICDIPDICRLDMNVMGHDLVFVFDYSELVWSKTVDGDTTVCCAYIPLDGYYGCGGGYSLHALNLGSHYCETNTTQIGFAGSATCDEGPETVSSFDGDIWVEHQLFISVRSMRVCVRSVAGVLSYRIQYEVIVTNLFQMYYTGTWVVTTTTDLGVREVIYAYGKRI